MNPATESNRSHDAAKAWCVLLVLSGCVLLFAFKTRECFVDDAYIGFQYVENLMAGQGFVFHAGDKPVEGATNIGWLLPLAPLTTLVPPAVAAKLLGLALVMFVLTLLVAVGRVFALKGATGKDSFVLAVVPAVLLTAGFDFVYFSTAGMETALLAAMLMIACCTALFRPHSLWLPALAAAASLVHPEAALVYPIYVFLRWPRTNSLLKKGATAGLSSSAGGNLGENTAGQASSGTRNSQNRLFKRAAKDDRRRLIGGAVLWSAILGLIMAARWGYFGDVVPNTFHSKPSNLQLTIQNVYGFLMGRNPNVAFPIVGWLSLPVLVLGYLRLRRAAPAGGDMLAAVATTGLLFAVYSPPDWTATARCFAPYLPAALLLFWAGIVEVSELLFSPTRDRTRQFVLAGVVVLLALTMIFDGRTKLSRLDDYPGYVMSGKDLVGPAVWIRDNLPDGATIATRRIGAVAYYSRRKVFDYAYGLPDAEAARLVARNGGRFDSPSDPALEGLWQARKPDYLLEDAAMIDYIISRTGGTRERFPIHGIEYGVMRQFPIGRNAQWVLAGRLN